MERAIPVAHPDGQAAGDGHRQVGLAVAVEVGGGEVAAARGRDRDSGGHDDGRAEGRSRGHRGSSRAGSPGVITPPGRPGLYPAPVPLYGLVPLSGPLYPAPDGAAFIDRMPSRAICSTALSGRCVLFALQYRSPRHPTRADEQRLAHERLPDMMNCLGLGSPGGCQCRTTTTWYDRIVAVHLRHQDPAARAEVLVPFGSGTRLPERPPDGPESRSSRDAQEHDASLGKTLAHMKTLPDIAVLPGVPPFGNLPQVMTPGAEDRINSINRINSKVSNRKEEGIRGLADRGRPRVPCSSSRTRRAGRSDGRVMGSKVPSTD
jgi:hypothetical protein